MYQHRLCTYYIGDSMYLHVHCTYTINLMKVQAMRCAQHPAAPSPLPSCSTGTLLDVSINMLYTGMYWYVPGTYWWVTLYVLYILVCTWYVHGTTMLWYEIMAYSTGPPKYAIFPLYSRYLLSRTSGHDPSEFSFLKIGVIGTWS